MKKIIFSLLAAFLLLFGSACRKAKKDYNDYLPKTKTVSATVQPDGSVVVQGEVESEGEAAIEYIGFCCDTKSSPLMNDRQSLCTMNGTKFTTTFTQLSADSAYNFRAFATNRYGYSYSNILHLDSIVAPHVTAPCSLTNETVNTGVVFGNGSYYDGPHPLVWSNSYGAYQISANTLTNVSVNIYVNASLSQGIYTTTGNSSPGYREMYVTFVQGNFYVLNSGSSVYVNKISQGTFDVSICSAPWQLSSSTVLFSTRFTASN